MGRLKILINASIVDPKPTGLGKYTLEVVNRLINMSNDFFDYYVITSVPEFFNIDRNHILEISKFTQPLYGRKAAFLRFIYSNFISFNFDEIALIYSPTHHGLLKSSVKQIITIHDLLPIKFKSIYSKESVAYFYYKFILPKLIKKVEKLIVPSEHTKFDIVNLLGIAPENIAVVYNGIDLKYNTNLNKDDFLKKYGINRQYILSVGTTSFPYKNAEGLVKAFSKIRNKLDYELVFCGGRNRYVQKLKCLVYALRIEKRVKFLNYLEDYDLYHLYKFSSVFVYPSTYEGFGFPPLEAMACGCPVVVSNTASLPEVCGDAVYYVDPYDVDSIAEGIYKVLIDENLRKTLIQKGLERAKLFSWEKTARQILKVFEEVLRKG